MHMPRSITLALPVTLVLTGLLLAACAGAQDTAPSAAPSVVPTPAMETPGTAPAPSAAPSAAPSVVPTPAPETPGTAPALAPPQATPNPVAFETPTGDGTGVRLTTDLGDIVIGLFTESAPVASENFLNLARSGYYDGVGFHRVAPGFVLQGGDPEGTGAGGPGYTIADEEVVGEYGRGIVAMARTREPNSQGSQFFVVLDDQAKRSLDAARTYAIFGRVVEGMDVVDAIVARGPASDLIEDPVRIQSASIEQVELPAEPTPAPPTAAEMAAAELAAKVPESAAGIDLLDRAAFDSTVVLPEADPALIAELEAVASEHGTDLEGLSIARASGASGEAFASVVAVTIPGVPAADVQEVLSRLIFGVSDDVISTQEVIAGREVTRYEMTVEGGPAQIAYGLPSGEAAWFLVTDEGSLEEVIAALP
jgi:peptidyl-prolyl cis-trans isomerase B (cyclophilin B)